MVEGKSEKNDSEDERGRGDHLKGELQGDFLASKKRDPSKEPISGYFKKEVFTKKRTG